MSVEKPQVEKKDYEKNMPLAVIAYFAFFVPLALGRKSKYVLYHTNQGLIFFVTAVIALALSFVPVVGAYLMLLGNVYVLVYLILGVRNAANGIAKPLPLIGRLTIIKSY